MSEGFAILYGFIQGLTEFLPVSSSGHLAIIPFFFELQDPGVVFDLMMHLGTAMAVILYFYRDILKLIREFFNLILKRNFNDTVFIQNFMVATISSFILILVIKDVAFEYGRSPMFIAFNLFVFGGLMFWSDRSDSIGLDLTKKLDLKKSIIIGLSQSLAVFPGVSRSGITLTSSRFLGMGRLEASRFSFLLSLPVILGSVVFKLPEVLKGEATHVGPEIMLIGVIASFIFGLITIHFFLKLIARIGLGAFFIYRALLAAILIFLIIAH